MSLLAENERDWHLYIGLDLATQSFSEPSLTIKHLDAISRVERVVVWHAGGHRMTVNSVMLARLNIDATTVDPSDSEYGRFDDGSPDGNIAGLTALTQALDQIEPFQLFDRYAGSVNLAREWVSHGVTTVGLPLSQRQKTANGGAAGTQFRVSLKDPKLSVVAVPGRF